MGMREDREERDEAREGREKPDECVRLGGGRGEYPQAARWQSWR
jgi:hypothetical protein